VSCSAPDLPIGSDGHSICPLEPVELMTELPTLVAAQSSADQAYHRRSLRNRYDVRATAKRHINLE